MNKISKYIASVLLLCKINPINSMGTPENYTLAQLMRFVIEDAQANIAMLEEAETHRAFAQRLDGARYARRPTASNSQATTANPISPQAINNNSPQTTQIARVDSQSHLHLWAALPGADLDPMSLK